MERALVLGATGGTGRRIAAELLRRGVGTRVASRSRDRLVEIFGDTGADIGVVDAADRSRVRDALRGCDVLFHCVGLPMEAFGRHVGIARAVTGAAEDVGARPLLLSSYWSYGPLPDRAVSEDFRPPLETEASRIRRREEDVFLEAGGAAAILPDFFGPHASVSVLNDALASVADGSTVYWPGSPDAARDFLFLPDLGPVLCDLAEREACWGRRWNVPGSGARPPRRLLEEAAGLAGSPKVRSVGPWMTRIAGLFDREIRGVAPLLPLYRSPVRLDGTRLESLLGPADRTPYDSALSTTLEWLRSDR